MCYILCICRGNKIENSTFYTVTERCEKSTEFVKSVRCPLTSLTSSKEEFVAIHHPIATFSALSKVKFVAEYACLLHFSLLLLQFLLLVLHFLGSRHMIATYSRPIDAKYVAILVFSFCFATFYAFRSSIATFSMAIARFFVADRSLFCIFIDYFLYC